MAIDLPLPPNHSFAKISLSFCFKAFSNHVGLIKLWLYHTPEKTVEHNIFFKLSSYSDLIWFPSCKRYIAA